MRLQSNLLAAAAAVLAIFIAVPNSATADVTDAQIAAARSPADHEAIARAYETDAVTAESKAQQHRTMARAYRSTGGPKSNSNSMVRHCDRLVKNYTAAAADYRALAAEHRSMAKDTTK